jgi:hypothetical protein
MKGIVRVSEHAHSSHGTSNAIQEHMPHTGGHSGNHLKHYHGFVTGGKSGERLYMTHTPVIADNRHHWQVVLQGRLTTSEHINAYNAVRKEQGDIKVEVFQDDLSLADIGSGVTKELKSASFVYYPETGKAKFPGLNKNIPVRIDRIIHFRQFEPEMDYPDGLDYIVYGDSNDVFIEHFISRAPSFHSVAKLKGIPRFWTDVKEQVTQITVPSKQIRDVSAKIVRRAAYVDNAFHLFWLPPPGVYGPQPQDPLIRRDNKPPIYDVVVNNGVKDQIEIATFIHFDVRLLNYGVLIL